uniref:Uncharacterized mitochondrial protein AtMg00300-like n=1 Tax=Nicotiana tabacum TaxID=4097 RepID=A0A1S3YVW8_TOBAC|nr:PREDICTED: uncharacterized mitochondrial protein AtMg00300-like [Nicotiana tabacum]
MVLMKGKLNSKLYHLQASIVEGEVVVASRKSDKNQSQLWHLRLSHMSDKGLIVFVEQSEFTGWTRVKFSKKAEHKTRYELNYIHSDL